jgi:hypothetical protein
MSIFRRLQPENLSLAMFGVIATETLSPRCASCTQVSVPFGVIAKRRASRRFTYHPVIRIFSIKGG